MGFCPAALLPGQRNTEGGHPCPHGSLAPFPDHLHPRPRRGSRVVHCVGESFTRHVLSACEVGAWTWLNRLYGTNGLYGGVSDVADRAAGCCSYHLLEPWARHPSGTRVANERADRNGGAA